MQAESIIVVIAIDVSLTDGCRTKLEQTILNAIQNFNHNDAVSRHRIEVVLKVDQDFS